MTASCCWVREVAYIYCQSDNYAYPEGVMLEGLLRQLKSDRDDFFSQLPAI